MNYILLILFIAALCIGGYYGYTSVAYERVDAQHKIGEQRDEIDALEAQNKVLEADKNRVSKADWDATQAKIVDLTQKLQAAQDALVAEQKKEKEALVASAHQAQANASPPPPLSSLPLLSNNLGTIRTQDGMAYRNCKLLKVKADGIVVDQAGGVIKILYVVLPLDLQKRFGYDPSQSATLTEDQVYLLDSQREAEAAQNPND